MISLSSDDGNAVSNTDTADALSCRRSMLISGCTLNTYELNGAGSLRSYAVAQTAWAVTGFAIRVLTFYSLLSTVLAAVDSVGKRRCENVVGQTTL